MIIKNYDESAEINHNSNYPYILYHLYGILIIGGSRFGKTNVLLNLTYIDKIYLYVKFPFQSKYQLLDNEREKVELKA